MGIVFSSSSLTSGHIARQLKAGKLRKLAAKIYSDDLVSPPEDVIRRHWREIVARFYDSPVVSHRSALENGPSPRGRLHLTVAYAAAPLRILPGLEIRAWRGAGPDAGAIHLPLAGSASGLHVSTEARAVLENLQSARARRDDEAKTLPAELLERWIDSRIRRLGATWLDALLRQARDCAPALGLHDELATLDTLASALKGEPSPYRLHSAVAKARAQGAPFDPERLALFNALHARLAAETFRELPVPPPAERSNRAFWEAYFSNFIEGTKFTVDEARGIIYATDALQDLRRKRPEDAHDVESTYQLIVDTHISSRSPAKASDYIDLLKIRHARLMARRPHALPGVFKDVQNQVGGRLFVAPDLVPETLRRAWLDLHALPTPTARALYALFVIAEIHPFNDGNGRVSRLAMNTELERAGCARLILPTSLRHDYLSVLEALTSAANPEPLIRFAHRLIEFNSLCPFAAFEETHAYFHRTGCLEESSQSFGLGGLLG